MTAHAAAPPAQAGQHLWIAVGPQDFVLARQKAHRILKLFSFKFF
jgi:hypothetical protein